MRTLIIAEAGVNHNGDIGIALELIDAAAAAGADVVKFQTFSADRLVNAAATKAAYQTKTTDATESMRDMLRRYELSAADHERLAAHCASRSVEFCSSGFDIESVDLLVALDVKRMKIPSGEITNLPYLRHIGALGRPVILSTGMATLGEVEAAVDVLERAGTPRGRMTVLQCNTEYPTPYEDVNLRAMLTFRDAFGVAVGYSDHTIGGEVSIAAVALGASVIEKHFTLDRTLPGPDHAASMEPAAFAEMVAAIRHIERALGDGIKRPSESEAKNTVKARKSIVAARAIRAGERFGAGDLTVKRPGSGLSPMRWDDVIGRSAPRDFVPDEPIEL
jgi:N,N'-diacetyllegionaminate synthase